MASRRGYLTIDELEEFADIEVTDNAEAEDQISQAEEIIDAYVGAQEKFFPRVFQGEVSAVSNSNKTLADTGSGSQLHVIDDYFKGCELEIIGGAGAGQRGIIESSSKDNRTVTLAAAFSVTPDTTSVFRIYQLGKFPRYSDVYTNRAGTKYFKAIPEAVKRATAAQVQFIIEQGDKYFSTDQTDMTRERIGNYEYEKAGAGSGVGQSSLVKLLAPKARALLRGIKNSTGQFED
jgi:hypothetical protein